MSSISITAPIDLSSCQRDDSHYFDDVYFLVAKTIFRLPRHHFEQESPLFREMFALPGTPKAPSPAKGLLESENPLHRLTDIDIDEFKQFLRVLYPRHFEDEKLQPNEWVAVLKLATTWRFEKVRRIAIKAIEGGKMTGTKGGLSLLMLSQTYDVKEWLLPALRILSTDKPLKEDFVEKISLTTSLKVATLQGLVTGFRMKAAKGAKDMEIASDELDRIIKTVFPEVDVKESETPNGSTNGTKGPDGGKSSK